MTIRMTDDCVGTISLQMRSASRLDVKNNNK